MKNKKLLTILGVTTLLVGGMFVNQEAREVSAATVTGGTVLFMKPNSNWLSDGARFAMYLCNGSSNAKWYSMTDDDGDGVYQAVVGANESHKNVIFCRMNGGNTTNDWNNKWDQTGDLTWDGSKNLYTISGWGGGTWASYTPTYHLEGSMSGWATNDSYKFVTNTSTEVKLTGIYLPLGTQFKVKGKTNYFNNVKNDCSHLIKIVGINSNIEIQKSGVYDFYWDFITNQLWIAIDEEKSLNAILDYNYKGGNYVRNTVINLTEKAQEELETYFHAKAKQLERTTYFTEDALWMSRGDGEYSYYGSEGGNLTNGTATEAKVVPPTYHTAVKETSMEKYYTTLEDIKGHAANATWTESNGVYTSTDEQLIEDFLAFTAPCFLNFNDTNANYFVFTGVSIQDTTDGLVLKLLVDGTMNGALSVEADANGHYVLSQATITK